MDNLQNAASQAVHMQVAAIVIVGIMGWIITHVLREESEREKFRSQIKDTVRIEIIKGIRDYITWLATVSAIISAMRTRVRFNILPSTKEERDKQYAEENSLFFDRKITWALYLEEYEILFPETVECRFDLLKADNEIVDLLHNIFNSYWKYYHEKYPAIPLPLTSVEIINKERDKFISDYKNAEEVLLNQEMLMFDLKNHLQNICLGELFHRELPLRSPVETEGPHIIREKNGKLTVTLKEMPKDNSISR